ncbi:MAG: NusG domain II-containing protein [Clostridiales bacterium]|nr:NusG domain II-containing protein [Clostridiales bacterium]
MNDTAIKKYRLSDFILIGIIIICAFTLTAVFFTSGKNELCVSVYQANKLIYQKALSEVEKPYEYTVYGDLNVTVLIENDGVTVISSDCPDKLCQKAGKLTQSGQSSVCLPARVSIILEDSANATAQNELDGIAR